MKNILYTLALLVSFNSFGQESLLKRFKDDIEAVILYTKERNWDKLISFSFPEIFDFITKEQLIQQLAMSFDAKVVGFEIEVTSPTNISVSEPIEFGGSTYYRIDYNNNHIIKIVGGNVADMINVLDELYRIRGARKFSFDEKTKTIYVKDNKVITIAKKNNSYKDSWKYLEAEKPPLQSPRLKQIVPIFVLKKFKII